MSTLIHKNLPVVPKIASPTSDEPLAWAYVSVEREDTDGDMVRVKGMSYDEYHRPPESFIKVMASHLKSLPDGTPPIVGRVEKFVQGEYMGDGQKYPALMCGWSWAKDGEGNITKLAKTYKDLFEGGYLDSVSPGFIPVESKPIGKGRGRDYTNTKIVEVSLVSIPANSRANAVVSRALSDAGFDIDSNPDRLSAIEKAVSEFPSVIASEREQALAAILKRLDDRFDDFIGAYVLKAKGSTPPENANGATPEEIARQIVKAFLATPLR
jgi:hypothetical protein